MATHSGILAWRIPWTEEPGGLQAMGSQRVRHDWVTNTHSRLHTLSVGQAVIDDRLDSRIYDVKDFSQKRKTMERAFLIATAVGEFSSLPYWTFFSGPLVSGGQPCIKVTPETCKQDLENYSQWTSSSLSQVNKVLLSIGTCTFTCCFWPFALQWQHRVVVTETECLLEKAAWVLCHSYWMGQMFTIRPFAGKVYHFFV